MFMTLGIMSIYCQKRDTIFYSNRNIRSIEIQKDKEKVLEKFNSETGENLLINDKFHYEYFDSIMQMRRVLDVVNYKIEQEFWISDNDTVGFPFLVLFKSRIICLSVIFNNLISFLSELNEGVAEVKLRQEWRFSTTYAV